jgi:hypothetical protein
VLAQAKRFALHLEIPAVLHGVGAQVTPGRDLALPIGPRCLTNSLARDLQLLDERFERPADAPQGRRSLFLQLAKEIFVGLARWATEHAIIVAENGHTNAGKRADDFPTPNFQLPKNAWELGIGDWELTSGQNTYCNPICIVRLPTSEVM